MKRKAKAEKMLKGSGARAPSEEAARLRARLKRWEDQEIERASCCMRHEQALREIAASDSDAHGLRAIARAALEEGAQRRASGTVSSTRSPRPRQRAGARRERRKILSHEEPSAASLREMPEVDFSKGTWRRNHLAARIAKEGATFPGGYIPPRRGRRK